MKTMSNEYFKLEYDLKTNKIDMIFFILMLAIFFHSAITTLFINSEIDVFHIIRSIVILLFVLYSFMRIFRIKPFYHNTFISLSKEEVVFKLSPVKRAVKINWDHVEQLNINDLNLKFIRGNEIIGELNMGWIPMNEANKIKLSIIEKAKKHNKKIFSEQ